MNVNNNLSNSGGLTALWVILCLILLAIVLFAIFWPRRRYQQSLVRGQAMQPYPMMNIENFEGLDGYEDLMESMSNPDDAQSVMNSDQPMMVFFYAPWCGHCQNAKPAFQQLMAKHPGKAAMINCDEHKEIAQQLGIQGFPTIRYYPNGPKNGNHREYQGDRSADDMERFMQ